MSHFLSNGYHFTENNLINKSSYFTTIRFNIIIFLVVLVLTTIAVVAYVYRMKKHPYYKIAVEVCMLVMLVSGAFISYRLYANGFSDNPISTPRSYSIQEFKFADKSNLYVTIDRHGPKTRLDNTPYPYRVYISRNFDVYHDGLNHNGMHDETEDRHYIGSMNHGKFKPNDTELATVFYKYMQYIKQHNLDNKFKKCAYLEYDARYMTNNNKPQLVLTNHKDIVLHLKDDATVEQSKAVNK